MTPEEIAANLIRDYGYNLSTLQHAIANAIHNDRRRHAQALQETKRRLQEDGAIWWNIGALDEFIAALLAEPRR